MAREQRKDVDYFPHDCTHGRKMHIIESKYGNDGYATWFKLLEQLGKANNHYLDISDEMTLMFLTSTFKIDEDKTMSILSDLAKLGAIDIYLFETHKVIYSQKFCDSIQDAYRKRKNKMYQYSDVLNEILQKRGQSAGDWTQKAQFNVNPAEVILKEKDRIVKDSKEEEMEKNSDNDFLNYQILFFKNYSEDFDFAFEIQKAKNLLDDESLSETEKLFQSQVLNFLIEEKIKKVAPKKENNHQKYIDELKNSEEWLNVTSLNNKASPEKVIEKLTEFDNFLKSITKIHPSKSEFVKHFINWLPSKINQPVRTYTGPEKKTFHKN